MTSMYKRVRPLFSGIVLRRVVIFLVGAGVGIASTMLPGFVSALQKDKDGGELARHSKEIPQIGHGYARICAEEKDEGWISEHFWAPSEGDQEENAAHIDGKQWLSVIEEWCKNHSRVVSERKQVTTTNVVARAFRIETASMKGAVFCFVDKGGRGKAPEVALFVYESDTN